MDKRRSRLLSEFQQALLRTVEFCLRNDSGVQQAFEFQNFIRYGKVTVPEISLFFMDSDVFSC